MSDILQAIFQRRSIRKYQERTVEREKLDQLLRAAMAAPSAGNGRPWEFVVVTDPATMAQFRQSLKYGNHNAPAAIAVCANLAKATYRNSKAYWVQDCSAAVENILIAAVGLGLGTVWIGIYPRAARIRRLRQLLNLPEHVTPLALVYVGYPETPKEPRTQYDPERVHWERYRS